MKSEPDYSLPINNEKDYKPLKDFIKNPSPVEIVGNPSKVEVELMLTKSLLNDLLSKGYNADIRRKNGEINIGIFYPKNITKDNIRTYHVLGVNTQLSSKATYEFIKKMEAKRLHNGKWLSIINLMRDGEELADVISNLKKLYGNNNDSEFDHTKIINPYIQFVKTKKRCVQTGFYLNDIWRYFRHTWSMEYKSLPGRSVRILIRDKAVKNHPVIGIAALGSPVMQSKVRDKMLGWAPNHSEKEIKIKWKWYQQVRKILIDAISLDNLLNKKFELSEKEKVIVRSSELNKPTVQTVKNLKILAGYFMDLHHSGDKKLRFKPSEQELISKKYWKNKSNENLYKSKRCKALSIILSVDLHIGPIKKGYAFIKKMHYNQLVRMIKAEKVGNDMMDIIICGAIAPYNELLGGKLVAMLLASPEVSQYVKNKYSKTPSLIASAIKGAPAFKKPNLVFLCTTSLYGGGLSQYTRISIPKNMIAKTSEKGSIRYRRLGKTEGYGRWHISSNTMALCTLYNERVNPDDDERAPQVSYIFGEGTNPTSRMIRQAFHSLKYPADDILKHKFPRDVYGISLIENLNDYLLWRTKRPKFIFPQKSPKMTSKNIVNYWFNRWFVKRIKNDTIIEKVRLNTHEYPIKHGAKIQLPEIDDYGPLFNS